MSVHAVGVRSAAELDGAFSTIVQARPDVLLVDPNNLFYDLRQRLGELALKHRLPTVYGQREYVEETGSLMSYGADFAE